MTLRVRGRGLPSDEWVDLVAAGDRWTVDPAADAELVLEGWLVPGLVDAHTHPGAHEPGDRFDEQVLRDDLRLHADSGVTLIRCPGLAGEPPEWFGRDPDLPRAVHAGPWMAQHGQFFDGWGVRAEPSELPHLAAAQAAASGWVKLIGDWLPEDPSLSVDVIRAVVESAHAAGGRVAVHSQHEAGGAAAVAAGVDTLEHGMCLDPDLLQTMAEQGTALTPTLRAITSGIEQVRERPDSPRRRWFLAGAEAHPALVAAAFEAGVRVMAGTDSDPHGRVADEVRAMVAAGVPPHDSLGAASWAARDFLGFLGLEEGAPADVVIYEDDPRDDLSCLDRPLAVILRGQPVTRANSSSQ